MNTPTTDTIIELITFYSVQVIAALIILFFGRWLAQHLARLLGRMMERHKVDPTLVHFTEPLSYYTLLVMVVIAAAGQIGINTTSFLTIVGAAGLAIALALKDSLSNFSAGIMLVLFRPFKVGDIVTVAGGVTAQVQQITLFSTNLCTADNQLVIVPNNKIVSDTITNINAKDTRRIDLTVKLRSSANIANSPITVDVPVISISIETGEESFDYGKMNFEAASSTLTLFGGTGITAINDGNVIETFYINGQNTACPWALVTDVPSVNQYKHQFCNMADGCSSYPTNYTAMTTNYLDNVLATDIAASGGMIDFQLRITAPFSTSCYSAQNADVTIVAVEQ